MANRVPLIVDTTNLHLKELPLGDALDLTGCGIVGLTSFTPGTGGGFRFVGVTTFGMGTGIATVFVNDGLIANYLRATNLTDNQVITAGVGGSITSSSNLTFDETTLAVTGAITASTNLTVNGNVDLGNAATDSITPTGRFDAHIVPLTDGDYDLGASGVEFKDLYIDGTANIDALIADSAKIVDIGNEQILFCNSADGEVAGNAALTWDGSTLAVTGDLDVSGSLNYTNVTDIYSVGIITANGGIIVSAGFVTCSATDNSTSTTTGVLQVSGGAGIVKNLNVGLEVKSEDLNITGISTLNDTKVGGGLTVTGNADLDGTLDVDGATTLDGLTVAEAATFSADVTLTGATKNATWSSSNNALNFADGAELHLGDNAELKIYHQHSNNHSYIKETGTGSLVILADDFYVQDTHTNTLIMGEVGGGVGLYHTITGGSGSAVRVGTTTEGADITGTGALRIPVGNSDFRPSSPAQGDIRYNTTINTFEGYDGSVWGGLGGGTEIDNVVATASATGIGTFAHASYRSASVRVQITQGSAYQIGRYLMIHDGTTVTVVEEAAIATGSMLGTIDGVISGSNAVLRVTMGSASNATITTIIDKISV